jgi:hypothetical protein
VLTVHTDPSWRLLNEHSLEDRLGRQRVTAIYIVEGWVCHGFNRDNCDACYFCKTETAEEKGKVAEEVIAERNKEVKSENEEETAREGNDKGEREARAEGGR